MNTREFIQQEIDIRMSRVIEAQLFANVPMPVCTNAITPAIPDTHTKPGESGQQYGQEMPFSGGREDPSQEIK